MKVIDTIAPTEEIVVVVAGVGVVVVVGAGVGASVVVAGVVVGPDNLEMIDGEETDSLVVSQSQLT